MNNQKTGELIRRLRKEKGYTQKQLAERLHISPKTVSKWETAAGCPDISLIMQLAQELDTTSEHLLQGNAQNSTQNGGNMKRLQFYYCEVCDNLLTGTDAASISCCGRKLKPLKVQPMDAVHMAKIEILEDEYYITFSHEMKKTHYIRFVALVSYNRVTIVRMYPEQNAELYMHLVSRGELYLCCSQDGLFKITL